MSCGQLASEQVHPHAVDQLVARRIDLPVAARGPLERVDGRGRAHLHLDALVPEPYQEALPTRDARLEHDVLEAVARSHRSV